MVPGRCKRLALDRAGQVTSEYAGVVAVIIAAVLAAWYLLVPPLKQGFMDLCQRIIDMNP